MAIIGNVKKLELFLKDKDLRVVFEYFKQSIIKDSEINRRIFSLPIGAFEKVKLTDDIFALEQVAYTKNREDCYIEAHKEYIDFQLVLSGSEQMEYVDINKLEIDKPYNAEKDLITYKMVDNTSKFLLEKNDLAIFFPDDAHIGRPKFEEIEIVHKTVIKFPIELWDRL